MMILMSLVTSKHLTYLIILIKNSFFEILIVYLGNRVIMNEKKCHLEERPWYSSGRFLEDTQCHPHVYQCHSCKNYTCVYHYLYYGSDKICDECMTLQCKWSNNWYKEEYEKIYMSKIKACKS